MYVHCVCSLTVHAKYSCDTQRNLPQVTETRNHLENIKSQTNGGTYVELQDATLPQRMRIRVGRTDFSLSQSIR